MTISFNNAVGLYESALQLRSEKASVIASNLANADTPNYKAKDVDFHGALQKAMTAKETPQALKGTNQGHMGSSAKDAAFAETFYRTPLQPSVDGNTVEEQVEHAEFMKNNMEFQAAFTILNSKFKGLSKAIRGE